MTIISSPARRFLVAGGFALAIASAPLAGADMALDAAPEGPFLTNCPTGEIPDPSANGACIPQSVQHNSTVLNPIDPQKTPLAAGGITSSQDGNSGELPTVNGIPCNGNHSGGGSTGNCIGLAGEQPTFHAPHASVNGVPVAPPSQGSQ